MYTPGTENKTEHRPDARHHVQEGKKKNMAKFEGPNSDCNIDFFPLSLKNPIMEDKHGTFFA